MIAYLCRKAHLTHHRVRGLLRWLGIAAALSATTVMAQAPSGNLSPAGLPREMVTLPGANVAGAEFNANRFPAIANRDYVYPGSNEIDLLRRLHLRLMRIPVAWERLQPLATGELAEDELRRLDDVIALARKANMRVVIDVHNYGAYRGTSLTKLAPDTLPDLWRRLALRYRTQPDVVLGVMNEPHDIGYAEWAIIARNTLQSIRRTGAQNVVAIPGTNWDGAHSWLSRRNGDSNASTLLPLAHDDARVVFEIHQYFDSDFSGTHPTCERADDAVSAIVQVTEWAKTHQVQLMLGEFAVSDRPECVNALERALSVIHESPQAWFGWTYWAAGSWWGNYPFSLQRSGGQTAQGDVLKAYGAGSSCMDQTEREWNCR